MGVGGRGESVERWRRGGGEVEVRGRSLSVEGFKQLRVSALNPL